MKTMTIGAVEPEHWFESSAAALMEVLDKDDRRTELAFDFGGRQFTLFACIISLTGYWCTVLKSWMENDSVDSNHVTEQKLIVYGKTALLLRTATQWLERGLSAKRKRNGLPRPCTRLQSTLDIVFYTERGSTSDA
eukprot:IDg4577t1